MPPESSKKFVAVLNKKIPVGRLMNALGHMTAGLAGGYGLSQDMHFVRYEDKEGGSHPYISHFPFIVLKADNSNQIRTLRNEIIARSIPYTDFTHTMIVGSTEEQLTATQECPEQALEYFGICVFGDSDELHSLTKKFSLL